MIDAGQALAWVYVLRAVTAPGPKQAWLDALDAWGRDVARSLA